MTSNWPATFGSATMVPSDVNASDVSPSPQAIFASYPAFQASAPGSVKVATITLLTTAPSTAETSTPVGARIEVSRTRIRSVPRSKGTRAWPLPRSRPLIVINWSSGRPSGFTKLPNVMIWRTSPMSGL